MEALKKKVLTLRKSRSGFSPSRNETPSPEVPPRRASTDDGQPLAVAATPEPTPAVESPSSPVAGRPRARRASTLLPTLRRRKTKTEGEDEDEIAEDEAESPEVKAEKRITAAAVGFKTTILLSSLGISDVPSTFTSLKDIARSLDISFNMLTRSPAGLEHFTSLQTLFLHGNQIQELSPLIGKLTNLKELQLNGNKIKTLPPELGCLESLNKLYCNNNQLTHLPLEIGCLTALEELHLSGNNLEYLPETIGNCLYLEIIDMNGCQLKKLPEQFSYLFRLIELDLGLNKLESLPQAIGCLTRLQKLNFADNLVTEVPLSLGNIFGLQICRGEGNKIEDEDLMYNMQFDAEHVIDYCQQKVLEALQPNQKIGDYYKNIEKQRPEVPEVWPPGKPRPVRVHVPKVLSEKEQKRLTLRREADLKEKVLKLKESARSQFEQICGFIAELNRECDPDSPPLDEALTSPLRATTEAMRNFLALWLQETWLEVEEDADPVVLNLALLDNTSIASRTLMQALRTEQDPKVVIIAVKHLQSIYSILNRHFQARAQALAQPSTTEEQETVASPTLE